MRELPRADDAILAKGLEILDRMDRAPVPGVFSKTSAYAWLMQAALDDPAIKTRLFRFVDVLPALGSPAAVAEHWHEYLGDAGIGLLRVASVLPAIASRMVVASIRALARQFVVGETTEDLVGRVRANEQRGLRTTVDLLGERVLSEREADQMLARNLAILEALATATDDVNLSVKLTALTPDLRTADPDFTIGAAKVRLRPLLRRAAAIGASINLDMEDSLHKDLTLALLRSTLEEQEFREKPGIGVALQAYLLDAEKDLVALERWAKRARRPITVRLVKGAYWDHETLVAAQRGWPSPVFSCKADTDASYEHLSRMLLERIDVLTPAFATHNVRSCASAVAAADRLGIDQTRYELQALYGMADDLKAALAQMGHRVREYCPVGEMLPGMSYLVRRLLENTSNEGFVRARATGKAGREALLERPAAPVPRAAEPEDGGFGNAPWSDFSRADERTAMRNALGGAARWLGRQWPLVVGGRSELGASLSVRVNPAHPDQVVGWWSSATTAHADRALEAARQAQPAWARTPARARATVLERLAQRLQERRFALAAMEIREVGKPWVDADADVAEAIDYCRFYAAEMIRLAEPRSTGRVPGETNVEIFAARGVGVVVAPWNFPLAILCGMTTAALVTGNAVVMKPAEQSSITAGLFMQLLGEAGLPDGVANLLTGRGQDVGAHLVAHPAVDFVSFTGSRTVGLGIWAEAARTAPGQVNLKKVVCEMGGKNALIVDSDADLDEAIPAALASAFTYAGQKCSALSRLIVLDDIHDAFVARLVAAAACVPVGDPADPGTVVGPVIDADARLRILAAIDRGKREARLAFSGHAPDEGTYVAPTIFADVAPDGFLATEEIFGPVLSILRAHDLDHAIAIANHGPYALTGGIFSRNPSSLRRAARELACGNVYLNRGITGALVGRQPFGGYRMSGGGTKAGGRGYLENFMVSRTVSENTVRRGFAPEG